MRNQLLRDADWAGMAHSVELRLPLVDAVLFRALARWLASGHAPGKADAVGAASEPVMRDVLARPKTGFSVPVRDWIGGGTTPAATGLDRGLRRWARLLLPRQPTSFRALVLVSDAYGGHGGIAKFNRDLLGAIAEIPECAEVVVLPRVVPGPLEPMPAKLRFHAEAAAGKRRYVQSALRAARNGPFDLVVAGHINLAWLAVLIARMKGARSMLVVHGIDAWTRHSSALVRTALPYIDRVVGVSRETLARFGSWSEIDPGRFRVLPNCVDRTLFAPGPKPVDLVQKYGLADRTVIMTLGRIVSQERYKGFDEVIDALPGLAATVPSVVYLVCGDGPDRARLAGKAQALGVADRVVFAGFVPESRKADHYRLADAFVMPSTGEGFGIVLLEALACGIPVLGSRADGSREALLDGALGELVDPSRPAEVLRGILKTLGRARAVPAALDTFSVHAFRDRVCAIAHDVLGTGNPTRAEVDRGAATGWTP